MGGTDRAVAFDGPKLTRLVPQPVGVIERDDAVAPTFSKFNAEFECPVCHAQPHQPVSSGDHRIIAFDQRCTGDAPTADI